MAKALKSSVLKQNDELLAIGSDIQAQITAFKPHLALITALANPGMRDRHWQALSDQVSYFEAISNILLFAPRKLGIPGMR